MIWVIRGFAALYGLALTLLAIGTFGWFGSERDPLSATFLLPLGLPWNVVFDGMVSETGRLWLLIGAPLINLGLLIGLYYVMRSRG